MMVVPQDAASLARSRRRVLLQVGLAIVAAIMVFVVVDAVENTSDPIIPGLTDSFSGKEWALMLLPFVGIILLIELYLLATRNVSGREDPVASLLMFIGVPPPRGRTVLMGCHGCGTLFSHDGVPNTAFACPNCNRQGIYRGSHPVTAPIQDKSCLSCGTRFEAYLEKPECPQCHTAQAT